MITEETYLEMKKMIANYESEQLNKHAERPYLEVVTIETDRKYNPKYGDNRICKCGHPYHRHFDSYEQMEAVDGYCTRCGKVALTSSTVCLRLEDVTEQAGINMVLAVSGPSVDEINKFLDDYGFVVPYDGSNKFYDETKIRHAKAGVDFVMNWIKEKGGTCATAKGWERKE